MQIGTFLASVPQILEPYPRLLYAFTSSYDLPVLLAPTLTLYMLAEHSWGCSLLLGLD
jgi:hypothetical protein